MTTTTTLRTSELERRDCPAVFAGGYVMIQPQPLPPKVTFALIQPQPLPPKVFAPVWVG
jgi:hypothetical protein